MNMNLGLIQAPATKIAGVLQAPAAQLARVLSAHAEAITGRGGRAVVRTSCLFPQE